MEMNRVVRLRSLMGAYISLAAVRWWEEGHKRDTLRCKGCDEPTAIHTCVSTQLARTNHVRAEKQNPRPATAQTSNCKTTVSETTSSPKPFQPTATTRPPFTPISTISATLQSSTRC